MFIEAIRNMLYWTYLGLKEQKYDFQSLLTVAVEQAEQDFAGKYSGKSVDVEVRFDIDVTRSADLDELIAVVESGGPVKANRLYDLLKMSSGVPIDPSELDTLRVWFQSSYPEGEKRVIESLFSEYLDIDVEIKDAIARVLLSDQDVEKTDAIVDPNQERPDPGVIKGRGSKFSFDDDPEDDNERRLPRSLKKDLAESNTENNSRSLDEFFDDEFFDGDRSEVSTIRELIAEPNSSEDKNESISPEDVLELLERIDESFVSTAEVAAALGAAPEAAKQALKSLLKESSVRYRSVLGKDGDETEIWWRSSAEDSVPS
jgi:hypothetical protein